jgi:hypothetical protein
MTRRKNMLEKSSVVKKAAAIDKQCGNNKSPERKAAPCWAAIGWLYGVPL